MTDKDFVFISALTKATEAGKLRWEPTAVEDEYTTSYKGKFSVLVKKRSGNWYGFQVTDPADREMIEHSGNSDDLSFHEWETIRGLFDLARREALHVDESIDDFISGLDTE